jgi:hypothetical protein
VFQFLESLDVIPTLDPFALALPTDPLKTFVNLNKVEQLSPPDEKWEIPKDSIALIKSVMRPTGKPKSERVIMEDIRMLSSYLPFVLPTASRL